MFQLEWDRKDFLRAETALAWGADRPKLSSPAECTKGAVLLATLVVALAGCGSPTDDLTLPTLEPAVPTSLVPTATVDFMGLITGDAAPLRQPTGLAIDSQSNIYVVESGTFGVRKFDWQGQLVTQWGGRGKDDGQFLLVGGGGIAIDPQDNVYVTDSGNRRIQKFDKDGHFLLKWGTRGTRDGEFNDPIAVAVDQQGNVYVLDDVNFNVQKLGPDGQFLAKWDGCPKDQMTAPLAVATDSQDNVYVSDASRDRICKFDSNGKFLATWGSTGTGNGQFDIPFDLVVDSKNTIYVIDYNHNRIEIFHQPL
jgi:DNA-binding beta-propeller fold protein YncE